MAGEVKLLLLSLSEIDQVWPTILEWVRDALGVDKSYLPEDIRDECKQGIFQLWVITLNSEITGFLVTSVMDAPRGRVCYGAWLGGKNLGDWVVPGLKILESWAKEHKCISLSFIGRKAWQKLIGFDYEGVFYLKNLGD